MASVPLVEAADIDEALEEPLVEKSKDSYDLVLVIRAKTGSAEWEDLLFRFSYAEVDYVVYERPRAGPKVRDEEADEPAPAWEVPLKFVALRASEDRLKREANRVGYPTPLCAEVLAQVAFERRVELGTDPSKAWLLPAYAFHHAPFHENEGRDCANYGFLSPYDSRGEDGRQFAIPDRVRLLASILAAPESDEGCNLPLVTAVANDPCVVDYFPLIPRDDVAPVGLVAYAATKVWRADASAISLAFSIVVVAWTNLYARLWRRQEARLTLLLGTSGFKLSQRNRPQFAAHEDVELRRSLTDHLEEAYYPEHLASRASRMSRGILGFFYACITAAIIALFYVRSTLNAKVPTIPVIGVPLGSVVAPAINALLMIAVDKIFERVALRVELTSSTTLQFEAIRKVSAMVVV